MATKRMAVKFEFQKTKSHVSSLHGEKFLFGLKFGQPAVSLPLELRGCKVSHLKVPNQRPFAICLSSEVRGNIFRANYLIPPADQRNCLFLPSFPISPAS